MFVRFMDGPRQGEVIDCADSMSVIEGVHEHGDGTASAITYRVERDVGVGVSTAAYFVGYGQRWNVTTMEGTIPWTAPADEHFVPPTLLSEATIPELVTELARRGFRAPLSTPMRRRRRDMPRAGFGQRWPSD